MGLSDILDLLIDDAEFSVIDIETTGMSASYSRIIEIGIVRISKLEIVDTYSTFINPGREIPYPITKLTGIRNEDVQNAPFFDEAIYDISKFIGDTILLGHNFSFDMSFLRREFKGCGVEKITNPTLCTLRLARRLYPQLKSRSLGSMTNYFGIENPSAHRALNDASVTAQVFLRMIEDARENNLLTISDYVNYQYLPNKKAAYRLIKKKLINDYAELPDSPGIYFFRNSKDEIIYIGKAKSLKSRVRNYFSGSALRKTKKIIRQASRITYEATNSELTALLAEAELIKIHNPVNNALLKKYSQTYFIKINTMQDFPRPEVTKEFELDGCDYFGPYNNIDTVRTITELVDRTFGLRECAEKEFNKGKECYLTHIHRCLGPCTGQHLQDEYKAELNNVYDFLCGKNQLAVNRLIHKMKDCSVKQKFEEAAQYRDTINMVLSIINKASILSEPVNTSDVLITVSGSGDCDNGKPKKDHILLISGKIFIKDYLVKSLQDFDTALDDYFNGTVSLFSRVENRDIEKIKISLSWLIRNRDCIKVYYLKNFTSRKHLFETVAGGRNYTSIEKRQVYNIRNLIMEEGGE